MALSIDRGHTALLAMDFENDIVHENGAFKDFGFAAMVKQNDVLAKTARLLDAARRSGVKVIYACLSKCNG
ncbi:MAG: isochorismatase family protein [Chloroflexi bacterium]|nr:isochorismatase family protein [Chloroflexota bacterium]